MALIPRLVAGLLLAAALLSGCAPGDRGAPALVRSADACGSPVPKPGGGTWTCTFADDFAGRWLDPTTWVAQHSALSGFTMNDTCFRSGRGHRVSGGVLHLTVDREVSRCPGPDGARRTRFVGGGVSTWGRFSQAYGRFEVRMRFPSARVQGLHGGFWMNPQEHAYGDWPASGEIDVAEWFSDTPRRVYPSLHYAGSVGALDTGRRCVVGRADRFHTYAVVWTPRRMQFLYDGRPCFARTWQADGMARPAPFDRPFTLALVASGGAASNAATAATPFPSTFDVDWVRAWR